MRCGAPFRPHRPGDHDGLPAARAASWSAAPCRARLHWPLARSLRGRLRPAPVADPGADVSLGRPAAPWFVVAAAGVGLAITRRRAGEPGSRASCGRCSAVCCSADIVGGLRARGSRSGCVLATAVVLAPGSSAVGLGVDCRFPGVAVDPRVGIAAVYVGEHVGARRRAAVVAQGRHRPRRLAAAPPPSWPPPASGCAWPTTCTTSSDTRWRSSRSRASWRRGCIDADRRAGPRGDGRGAARGTGVAGGGARHWSATPAPPTSSTELAGARAVLDSAGVELAVRGDPGDRRRPPPATCWAGCCARR